MAVHFISQLILSALIGAALGELVLTTGEIMDVFSQRHLQKRDSQSRHDRNVFTSPLEGKE